jgi:hypothetical protein
VLSLLGATGELTGELKGVEAPISLSRLESKEVEVGGTCGTRGGGERCLQVFGWEARR